MPHLPRGKAYPTRTMPVWNAPDRRHFMPDKSHGTTAKNHAVLHEEMLASAKAVLPARRYDPARAPRGFAATATGPWPRQVEDAAADGLFTHYEQHVRDLATRGREEDDFFVAMRLWALSDQPWVGRAQPGQEPVETDAYVLAVFKAWAKREQKEAVDNVRESLRGWFTHADYFTHMTREFARTRGGTGREQMLEFLGVSSSTVSAWCAGDRKMPLRIANRVWDHHAFKNALHVMYSVFASDQPLACSESDRQDSLEMIEYALTQPERWSSETLEDLVGGFLQLFHGLPG